MARRTSKGGPLTHERILEAALELVDTQGMERLTMRRLATSLGVDPMAIYYHIPGKEALLAGLVTHVFSGMRKPPAAPAPWPDRVRAFARAYRALARAHPNLILHLVSNVEAAAAATLEASEALFDALSASGLPPKRVVHAADLVVDFVNGFVLGEVARPLGRPDDRTELLDRLCRLPAGALPAMRRVYDRLSAEEMAADFDFCLDVLLAGLAAVGREA